MRIAIRISAGPVATASIAKKNGEKKRPKPKRSATTTTTRPVRPPSAVPALDSRNVPTVVVPRSAPKIVTLQ